MRRAKVTILGALWGVGAGLGCGGPGAGPAAAVHAPAPLAPAALQPTPAADPAAQIAVALALPQPAPRRAKIRMHGTDEDDAPAPLVDVVIGGHPTSMLLDSGATHLIVASWVAAEIGATGEKAGAGTDHAGKSVAIRRLTGAKIVLSGWGEIPPAVTFIADLPDQLRAEGIGGVLPPQVLLEEGHALVLDLRAGTLTDATPDAALAALEATPGAAFSGEVRACDTGGTLPYVRATIAGIAVDAQVDTGASTTTVRAASPAGVALKPLAKRKKTGLAASGAFTVPSVESASIQVGAHQATTSVDVVPREPRTGCTNDAFLGLSALLTCTLVLSPTTLAARCAP